MAVSSDVRERIESIIGRDKVVLYMKGTRTQPQCGFSATVVGILDNLIADYATVNVLEDPEIREGIKAYSNWPTIPQLYVDNEFVGGCDVVQQMYNSGQLHDALDLPPIERTVPSISISDSAAEAIKQTAAQHQGASVHLKISPNWQHEFSLAPATGHEITASSNGVDILFDLDSAARAQGLSLDLVEQDDQSGFVINNPNAPPAVKSLSVETLKGLLDNGDAEHLYDVREPNEHAIAKIAGAKRLDERTMEEIAALPRDTMLIFHCHHGTRSQQAAEYYRQQGFTNVHNLIGGIDAWSQQVDPEVPRY